MYVLVYASGCCLAYAWAYVWVCGSAYELEYESAYGLVYVTG